MNKDKISAEEFRLKTMEFEPLPVLPPLPKLDTSIPVPLTFRQRTADSKSQI